MGSYYSGMMNNKDGYGELMHYRTKGSKNGISNTPGYVAVGVRAKGPNEKPQVRFRVGKNNSYVEVRNYSIDDNKTVENTRIQREKQNIYARQNDRNPRKKYSSDYNSNPLRNYKTAYDYVGKVVTEHGPKVAAYVGNGAREFARNSSAIANGVARGVKMLGSGIARDATNLGKAIGNIPKKYEQNKADWYEEYKSNREKYDYSGKLGKLKAAGDIANRAGKAIKDTYETKRHGKKKETNYMRNYYQEIGGLMGTKYDDKDLPKAEEKARKITNSNIKENKLRDKFIQAEKYANNMQKKYDAAVRRKDFDSIERLESQLNQATDRYIKAQNNYQSYRYSLKSNKYR